MTEQQANALTHEQKRTRWRLRRIFFFCQAGFTAAFNIAVAGAAIFFEIKQPEIITTLIIATNAAFATGLGFYYGLTTKDDKNLLDAIKK